MGMNEDKIGIWNRVSDDEPTVGTGPVRPCPLSSPSSLSPARATASSPPLLSSGFNLVLKICCTRGRLRYGRSDFLNVNRPSVVSPSSFVLVLRARGGNVATVAREPRAGCSRGGNGGIMCAPTSGLECSSVSVGEESGATSRPPNVETRLCPRRSDEDW